VLLRFGGPSGLDPAAECGALKRVRPRSPGASCSRRWPYPRSQRGSPYRRGDGITPGSRPWRPLSGGSLGFYQGARAGHGEHYGEDDPDREGPPVAIARSVRLDGLEEMGAVRILDLDWALGLRQRSPLAITDHDTPPEWSPAWRWTVHRPAHGLASLYFRMAPLDPEGSVQNRQPGGRDLCLATRGLWGQGVWWSVAASAMIIARRLSGRSSSRLVASAILRSRYRTVFGWTSKRTAASPMSP
jgi:hypothetical protein